MGKYFKSVDTSHTRESLRMGRQCKSAENMIMAWDTTTSPHIRDTSGTHGVLVDETSCEGAQIWKNAHCAQLHITCLQMWENEHREGANVDKCTQHNCARAMCWCPRFVLSQFSDRGVINNVRHYAPKICAQDLCDHPLWNDVQMTKNKRIVSHCALISDACHNMTSTICPAHIFFWTIVQWQLSK